MGRSKPVPGGPQVPLPQSGERVFGMPSGKSKFIRAPKPLTRTQSRTNALAEKQRQDWEASPVGQARTQGYSTDSGYTLGQRYRDMYADQPSAPGPRHYDVQLPGMADPDAAPRPPKWEELPETARQHTMNALKGYGTSIERMTSDVGAQIDQAHMRAAKMGHNANPYASHFYEQGSSQRDRIDSSAAELGIHPTIHAQLNAFTSPNTKFEMTKKDGTKVYPNDQAARHAVKWVRRGVGPASEMTNDLSKTGEGTKRAQGYLTNIRKAGSAVEQYDKGVAPADWRSASGKDMFSQSPKTGPYANSWNDSHPQFTVSDVHTGGGGFLPHLSSWKGTSGKKSGREQAIESTPFFHSAADYAMRQAMTARGLSSVRQTQAGQWGEEQLQRSEGGMRGGPTEAQAYPARPKQEIEGQTEMDFRPGSHIPGPGERDDRSPTAKRFGLPF